MSIHAISWAFNQNIKPSWLKFCLVALCDCSNNEDRFWPSIAHISSVTGLNRKTVIQAIDNLEQLNFIKDTGERVGKTGQIKVFTLNLSNSTENGTLQDVVLNSPSDGTVQRVPSVPSKSTVCTSKSTAHGTRNLKEPNKEPASWDEDVLPASWQDIAEAVGLEEEAIFKAWRKFKDVTNWPMKVDRWQAWVFRWKDMNINDAR